MTTHTNERPAAHAPRQVTLDDKYTMAQGVVFMTGIQALVRLPLEQRRRDRAAGLKTAGYISGYQGSPLAAIDGALRRAQAHLQAEDVLFRAALNEELAMTAVSGTQYLNMFPGARFDGVFSIWYGKGPGVDRSVDALRHANWAGTSQTGGVLALAGDDHGAKSSTVACYSDIVFESCGVPVLYPSNVQEILSYGLHGIALSRFARLCAGMKLVADVVESAGTVSVDPESPRIVQPQDYTPPPGGLGIRAQDFALIPTEERLYHGRLYAALAYIRANALNRIAHAAPQARVGIVSAGKPWQDVRKALHLLGLDEESAAALGLRLLKLGVTWPVEPGIVRHFAQGLETVVVVEEKRPFIETQVRAILYGQAHAPRIIGKVKGGHIYDAQPQWLFANFGEISAHSVAELLVELLAAHAPQLRARLQSTMPAAQPSTPAVPRTPSFCSGCPHNRSTKLPEGSRVLAGIGCHGMQVFLDPQNCKTIAQMGGEGMHWMGQQPFTSEKHVFANLGDGTYAHSGSLAIRQAVAFNAPITFKLLVNGFVSMTGGQTIVGQQSIAALVAGLRAEGVQRIAVLSDEPEKYRSPEDAPGVPVLHRSELERVQKELREYPGVSVLIYEQPCATERRRLRKQGKWSDPPKRSFINSAVCEGCGDCGKVSTCLSIEPLPTPQGRKRRINQSSCNKDFTCVEGFCPSFVTVHGGRLRKPGQAGKEQAPREPFAVPEPALPQPGAGFHVLVAGIGGTGVVTIGQVLAMAAHLDGVACLSLDMMGMAQKYGAVLSHLSFADSARHLTAARIGLGETDTLLGCDLIVASGNEPLATLAAQRSHVVVCSDVIATAEFARNTDWSADPERLISRLRSAAGAHAVHPVDGQRLAQALLGDAIASNMLMVGVAWQLGRLPLSLPAIERAIELNGVSVEMNRRAFQWGRCIAFDARRVDTLLAGAQVIALPRRMAEPPLEQLITQRVQWLTDYQDRALAQRYAALIERVRRAEPGGNSALSAAVAQGYYHLLAVKDEWEVARLYASAAFRAELEQTFEGDYRLHFHIGAWPLARRKNAAGHPVKVETGPWLMGVFRIMARLRRLRGTVLDPFRRSAERQLARELLAHYEQDVEMLIAHVNTDNYADAVALAALPLRIRGYGHVRQAQAASAAQERQRLLQALNTPHEPLRKVG